jgi:hypothetical protein
MDLTETGSEVTADLRRAQGLNPGCWYFLGGKAELLSHAKTQHSSWPQQPRGGRKLQPVTILPRNSQSRKGEAWKTSIIWCETQEGLLPAKGFVQGLAELRGECAVGPGLRGWEAGAGASLGLSPAAAVCAR